MTARNPIENKSCAVCYKPIDYENVPDGLDARDAILCSSCRTKSGKISQPRPDIAVLGAEAASGWWIDGMC